MSLEASETESPSLQSQQEDRLFPLGHFYAARGWSLPPFQMVQADHVPQPFKKLLVHESDMTSVLQNYHRQAIHIEPVEFLHQDRRVLRQVRLCDTKGNPVEFGAIEIELSAFSEAAQQEILASILPLGAILHKFKLEYISTPQGFFHLQSDRHIASVLNLAALQKLWGRVNVLRQIDRAIFAKVVEILPPL